MTPDKIEDRLLAAILADVAFDGWTMATLTRAGRSLGLDEGALAMLLPGGVADALDRFAAFADEAALAAADRTDGFDALKVRQKIAFLVRARLEALEPHREAVRRSLVVLARPRHVGLGPRLLWRTADRLWRRAGDTATDYNFYTKRALLSGVHASTQLYWLADRSEGRTASWAYLDRRIDMVLKVGRRVGEGVKRLGAASELPFRLAARLREAVLGQRAG